MTPLVDICGIRAGSGPKLSGVNQIYALMLSSTFVDHNNTKSFYVMSWLAFLCSTIGMLAGLILLEVDLSVKGYFAMAFLFSVSSCFTLAKVIRDRHETERLVNRVENAKTEKFLNEHGNPMGVS